MSAFADRVARRGAPRLLAASANVTLPARLAARARRARGERGRLELFFAFDDPCSAVAVHDLHERLRARPVELALLPVLRRGIAGDPAVEPKRRYALLDARRLARRHGLTLAREQPLDPAATAPLAEWVAGAQQGEALQSFCLGALAALWFEQDGEVALEDHRRRWRELFGGEPRADAAALRRNEARMRRRGPYETPAAWIAGRWYFAQDRPLQICEWLDELGWAAS